MNDKEIVELYWKRDENAILMTQEKYQRYLTKIAYNILTDLEDSRESVNDTYLAAWNSMPPHKPEVLSTYLGKLTRRISIDIFRKKNAVKRQASEFALSISELADCLPGGEMPEDTVETKLLATTINDFLRKQSEEARNLFIGRYYFLDSLKDVAAYCNVSESKAKSTLFRTRCALKEHLRKEGFVS